MKFNGAIHCLAACIAIVLLAGGGCSTSRPANVPPNVGHSDTKLHDVVFVVNRKTFDPNFEKTMQVQQTIRRMMRQSAGGSFNSQIIVDRLLRQYLARFGVILKPPALLFYNDRLGNILVRGTTRDCKAVKRALERLNQGSVIERRLQR